MCATDGKVMFCGVHLYAKLAGDSTRALGMSSCWVDDMPAGADAVVDGLAVSDTIV